MTPGPYNHAKMITYVRYVGSSTQYTVFRSSSGVIENNDSTDGKSVQTHNERVIHDTR